MTQIKLFVFPLDDVVLFPTAAMPLNIFEPRYIQMVNDSLATETPIAMTCADPTRDDTSALLDPARRRFGIVAGYGMPYVMHRRPNGSMVILLKGRGKARITDILQPEPYIICKAEALTDDTEVSEENKFALHRLNKILLKWIDANVNEPEQRRALLSNLSTPQQILDCLSICMVPDADLRQSILEVNDINARIRLMKFLF